jgi:hypothetical protein
MSVKVLTDITIEDLDQAVCTTGKKIPSGGTDSELDDFSFFHETF